MPDLSPDGRLGAFGAEIHRQGWTKVADAAWVLDTATGDLHADRALGHRSGVGAGRVRLYIAGEEGVVAYSLDDASTGTLDETALQRRSRCRGTAGPSRRAAEIDAAARFDLWLMGADGSDAAHRSSAIIRGCTASGPCGRRTATTWSCSATARRSPTRTGEEGTCSEEHDVILVQGRADGDAGGAGRNPDAHRAPGDGRRATPGNRGFPTASPGPPTARRSSTSDGRVTRSRTHTADGLLVVPVSGSTPPVWRSLPRG